MNAYIHTYIHNLQESHLSMTFAEPPSFLGGRGTPPAQKQLTPAEEMRVYCGIMSDPGAATEMEDKNMGIEQEPMRSSHPLEERPAKNSEGSKPGEGWLEWEREGREQRRPQATLRAWIQPKSKSARVPGESAQSRGRAATDAQPAPECLPSSSSSRGHLEFAGPRYPLHPLLQQQSRRYAHGRIFARRDRLRWRCDKLWPTRSSAR